MLVGTERLIKDTYIYYPVEESDIRIISDFLNSYEKKHQIHRGNPPILVYKDRKFIIEKYHDYHTFVVLCSSKKYKKGFGNVYFGKGTRLIKEVVKGKSKKTNVGFIITIKGKNLFFPFHSLKDIIKPEFEYNLKLIEK